MGFKATVSLNCVYVNWKYNVSGRKESLVFTLFTITFTDQYDNDCRLSTCMLCVMLRVC